MRNIRDSEVHISPALDTFYEEARTRMAEARKNNDHKHDGLPHAVTQREATGNMEDKNASTTAGNSSNPAGTTNPTKKLSAINKLGSTD